MNLFKKITAAVPLSLLLTTFSVMASSLEEGREALRNEDYTIALKNFRPLAEEGNPDAQALLGGMYLRGRGVEQNFEKAADWLKLAADQNDAIAQNNLGWLYQNGRGVSRDFQEAMRWLKNLGEGRNTRDQYRYDRLRREVE